MRSDFTAIVLAAGRGSRMGPQIPKVLVPLCGRPMLAYVLYSVANAGVTSPVIVVNPSGESPIREAFGDAYIYVVQHEQLGSGHAVMCAREAAELFPNVLVMCGDSPLFTPESVAGLMNTHTCTRAAVTLASSTLERPTGYGRILRDSEDRIRGIVEESEASEEQKAIREINGGCYAFQSEWLWANIDTLPRNSKGEYCLTDLVNVATSQSRTVASVQVPADEVAGVNTPDQLVRAEEILRARYSRA